MSKTKNVYIYEIPPVVLYNFTRLMDTLSHSDWMGFASRVVLDQTELRLTERCEDRTSRLLNIWSCRNGTVSELLTILEDLRMYRARDVILNYRPESGSMDGRYLNLGKPRPTTVKVVVESGDNCASPLTCMINGPLLILEFPPRQPCPCILGASTRPAVSAYTFTGMQTHSPPLEQPPSLAASQPPSLPPSQPFHSCSPSSFWHHPIKEYTKPVSESKHLPLPGPPPQASQVMSLGGRKPTAVPESSSSEPASLKSVDLYNSLSSCAMCWSFEEILRGTENFTSARQIGEGGFGVVYRATMRNTDYAVKKLKEDSQLDWTLVKQSFKTEVEKLSLYRHPNILDFAGYCIGEGAHCLLYVFMPNGSLEDRLHCQDTAALSWSQRISVLLGAAKALHFLHSCSPKVIHGDVKSSNILLGEHLEPKLGDFGLARLCQNPSRTTGKTTTVAQTKTVRGTLAYLPDEYLKDGQLGVEIDIYSFGVVLLEVLTGRRALEVTAQSKTVYLKDLVSELEDSGQSTRTGKHGRSESISTAAQHICRNHLDSKVATPNRPAPSGALEIAQLACQCLHRRRKKRPPMDEIFKTLQDNYKDQTYTCRSTINISSELPQPPPPQTPTWTDTSVEDLRSQFTKLGPQEDTYCCTQNVHMPSLNSRASSSSSVDQSKETLGMVFSQHFPCESDESQGFSQYFSSSDSSSISKKNIPETVRSQGDGDYSLSGSQVDLSPMSSAAGLSSERIVVNSAKQELVHKMALYQEGLLSSSELFSSGAGSYGEVSIQSQDPVESEEYEY